LKEIKNVLNYPDNQPEIQIAPQIEKCINDIKESDKSGLGGLIIKKRI
jgi:hypothetical protein